MEHDERGRRPGRPQQPPRGSSRRSGGPRRLQSGRADRRPARPRERPRPPAAPAAPYAEHGDAEPPRAPLPGRQGRQTGKRAPKRGARPGPNPRVFFGLAGALGAILVIAAVTVVVIGARDDRPAQGATAPPMGRAAVTGLTPASYSSSPSAAAYQVIAARSADPAPLTAAELFPSSAAALTPPASKARLTLRAKRLDNDCAAAIWGRALADDLRRAGCTQVGRTLHADTKKGLALSVAVLNLATVKDADRIVERLGGRRGGGFVRPPAAPAPLDRFGEGFGIARGLAMGHYAVVAWAQRLDGRGDEQDETLLSLVIEGGKAPAVLGRAARS